MGYKQEVIDKIDQETGLSFSNKDYTFIMGTRFPSFYESPQGLMSATMRAGYLVKKGDNEISIYAVNEEDEISQIINFLR